MPRRWASSNNEKTDGKEDIRGSKLHGGRRNHILEIEGG